MDDISQTGTSMDGINMVKTTLDTEFKIKDLGRVEYFLGIEVTHYKFGINICQRKYCLDLLKDTSFLSLKPTNTPLNPSVKLH